MTDGPAGVVAEGAVRLRVPLRRPLLSARGTVAAHEAWILRLRAPDGRTGVGETTLGPGATDAARDALTAAVRALVAGTRPLPDATADADPVERALRAATDGALLDLGLLPDLAVRRPAIVLNALCEGPDRESVLAAAEAAVAAGYRALKLKADADPAALLAAVRERVGGGIALRLDVNGTWPAAEAPGRLAELAPFRPAYVEQPVAPGDPAADAALRAGSPVPIALDESVRSLADARALLAAGAADHLVVKLSRVGGPQVALAIAREAAAAGVGVTIASLLETGIGLAAAGVVAAALPGDGSEAHGLATAELLVDDLVTGLPVISDGRTDVLPGPGLRLAPDREAIRALAHEVVGRWR